MRAIIKRAKRENQTIGFVPTMGALHAGHAFLLKKCRRENDLTILSIFVNPKQFGPSEDFKSYPRDEKRDIFLAKKENIDIIFHPSVNEMYPDRYLTKISVKELTESLCGKSRPGHFDAVATVVGKLLNITQPSTLYLGQKDAQQCAVIKQLVRDLNFPVKVKVVPTVREGDGLALSSRNRYLSTQHRQEAPVLYKSLCLAKAMIIKGKKNPLVIKNLMTDFITQKSSGKIDYIECVDAHSLIPLKRIQGNVLITLAVWFGRARLIDNIILKLKRQLPISNEIHLVHGTHP